MRTTNTDLAEVNVRADQKLETRLRSILKSSGTDPSATVIHPIYQSLDSQKSGLHHLKGNSQSDRMLGEAGCVFTSGPIHSSTVPAHDL